MMLVLSHTGMQHLLMHLIEYAGLLISVMTKHADSSMISMLLHETLSALAQCIMKRSEILTKLRSTFGRLLHGLIDYGGQADERNHAAKPADLSVQNVPIQAFAIHQCCRATAPEISSLC